MAVNDALLPEEATIYIVDSSTAPSTLASSDAVQAEITNWSESGGEEDVESVQVFGGGNIDKINPRTQLEVSFDVVLRYGPSVVKWDEFKWGSTLKSSGDSPQKGIYIQFTDGTNYYSRGYRAARGVMFEPDVSADGLVEGTMTFKLSPTDSNGNENFQVATSSVTNLTWSS